MVPTARPGRPRLGGGSTGYSGVHGRSADRGGAGRAPGAGRGLQVFFASLWAPLTSIGPCTKQRQKGEMAWVRARTRLCLQSMLYVF